MHVRAFDADIALAYIDLNIANSLNLCASHHQTQLSDRFVRVLVTVVGQLALMLNVHILFSCGSCVLGIESGVLRADLKLIRPNTFPLFPKCKFL